MVTKFKSAKPFIHQFKFIKDFKSCKTVKQYMKLRLHFTNQINC